MLLVVAADGDFCFCCVSADLSMFDSDDDSSPYSNQVLQSLANNRSATGLFGRERSYPTLPPIIIPNLSLAAKEAWGSARSDHSVLYVSESAPHRESDVVLVEMDTPARVTSESHVRRSRAQRRKVRNRGASAASPYGSQMPVVVPSRSRYHLPVR
jgi:hypothetical protein